MGAARRRAGLSRESMGRIRRIARNDKKLAAMRERVKARLKRWNDAGYGDEVLSVDSKGGLTRDAKNALRSRMKMARSLTKSLLEQQRLADLNLRLLRAHGPVEGIEHDALSLMAMSRGVDMLVDRFGESDYKWRMQLAAAGRAKRRMRVRPGFKRPQLPRRMTPAERMLRNEDEIVRLNARADRTLREHGKSMRQRVDAVNSRTAPKELLEIELLEEQAALRKAAADLAKSQELMAINLRLMKKHEPPEELKFGRTALERQLKRVGRRMEEYAQSYDADRAALRQSEMR